MALTGRADSPLAQAAEYFVATTGSDLNDGSATSPWATLQHAADSVRVGDRVTALPGDYVGFYLSTSGTMAEPIEFHAQPGASITQRNAVTPDGINIEGASHIVIDGFAVDGMPRAGVRAAGLPTTGMSHVVIRNVVATDNQRWGIFTGFVDDLVIEHNQTSGSVLEHGIYVSNSGDRPVVRFNEIWGNHGNGIHINGDVSQGGDGVISDALVSANVIYDNGEGGGSGVNCDGVRNSRIENNLLYDNHASGISLYRIDGGAASTGNVVVNNTIQQASDARWAVNIQDAAINNTLLNNILLTEHSYRGAVDVSSDSLSGLQSDYNVLASRFTTDGGDSVLTLAQWQAATGLDLHSHVGTASSVFVDATTNDYRLKSGTDAIDGGTSIDAPLVDLAGADRPVGSAIDVGAYEFGAILLAADFNDDGAVDGGDLSTWSANYGLAGTATHGDGDANGDQAVNGADLLAWQRESSAAAASNFATPVPEPNCLTMVACALSAVGPWARRSLLLRTQ